MIDGKLSGWRGLLGFQFVGPSASEIASVIRSICFADDDDFKARPSDLLDYSLRWRFLQNSESRIELCCSSVHAAETSEGRSIYFEPSPLT